jgi:signal transduction histidine kinase
MVMNVKEVLSMPLWLPTLIFIFALILIIDALGSFAFWKYTKNRLFFKASVAWGANFINFAIHGAAEVHRSITLIGHAFYFITACCLSSILCDAAGISFRSKRLIWAGVGSLALSLILYQLMQNYMISALVLDLFIAYPMLIFSFKALKKKDMPMLVKVFAVLLIVNGLHFLDYPFLHDSPVGSIVGFSLAFLLSILISILLPSLILQLGSRRHMAELESLVNERTSKLKERTQELEVMNKDNSTLLSIVCHDISTPVMIANYSLSKLMGKLKGLNAEEVSHSQKIQKNLNAVSEILRRVKDIHSAKLGKLEPQVQKMDVEPLLYEVTQMYQPLCEQKNIALNFIVKDQDKKIILLDPVLFKNQILGNLISNAVKFSENGQKIEILLSTVDEHVIIDIVDYGKGIDTQKMTALFEFNRPTSTRGTNAESGSGLGLPTVKVITEKMGGQIKVSSRADILPGAKGTIFSLKFKRASLV